MRAGHLAGRCRADDDGFYLCVCVTWRRETVCVVRASSRLRHGVDCCGLYYSLGKVIILPPQISYTPLSASGALCAVCCVSVDTWNNYIELGSKRRCVGYRQQNVQILAEVLC
jgi:hypothetical protein